LERLLYDIAMKHTFCGAIFAATVVAFRVPTRLHRPGFQQLKTRFPRTQGYQGQEVAKNTAISTKKDPLARGFKDRILKGQG